MAWVNIFDVPELSVGVDGVLSIVSKQIVVDTGTGNTGTVATTLLGHVAVGAPDGLAAGVVTSWRISAISHGTFPSPPTYSGGIFGGNFFLAVEGSQSFEDEAPPCYDSSTAHSGFATYGYVSNVDNDGWVGPGWGPGRDPDTFCSDPPVGVLLNPFDLSPLVEDGPAELYSVVAIADNGGVSSPIDLDNAQVTFTIEVDYHPVDSDFWTDFENSHEDDSNSDLAKDQLFSYIPEVPSQPYLPPSFDCYPPPPPPPPIVDPPGGGNGSGPPSGNPGGGSDDGCYYANVYQQWISCCGLPPDDPLACGTCSVQTVLVGTVLVCP